MHLTPRVGTPPGSTYPQLMSSDTQMTTYETLAANRIVPVYGVIMSAYIPTGAVAINQWHAQTVVDTLWLMNRESDDPITMVLDTPGGSIEDGMLIYDTMKLIEAPVHTIARLAKSMGAILLAAGEPGHRYVYPHGRVMIHQATMTVSGKQDEVEATMQENMRQANEITAALQECGVDKTGLEIKEDIRIDKWMDAQQSIDYGLADRILQPGMLS